jgi:DNA-binding LacI/PurR family transcriptional regulator
VTVDDVRGTRLAIEHVIALGHTRIGYVGLDPAALTAQRRLQGYVDAMAAAGLETGADLQVVAERSIQGGRDGIDRLFDQTGSDPPTAVFVAVNMSALGARAGLLDRGLRIPDDVSLITLLDHPINEHTAPPLTAVRMPNVAMGQEAVRMLINAIDGKPITDILIDEAPELVVRASTAAPPARGD